jgi:hypothetical protein
MSWLTPGISVSKALVRNTAVVVDYSAEADALFARMTTQPNATRKGHIDTCILALKTGALSGSDIWAKLGGLWLMAAHEEDTAKLNWKGATYGITLTDAPTWAVDQGYTTDGSNDVVDLNLNPSTDATTAQNSAHFMLRNHTNSQFATSIGGNYNGTSGQSLLVRSATDTAASRINSGSSSPTISSVTDARGLWITNRSASNALQLYRDGAQLGTATTVSVAEISATLRLGVVNGIFTSARFSAASSGSSLTANEAADLSNAIAAYLTAVGA